VDKTTTTEQAEQGTADEELKKVLRRAEQGDLTVLEQLRRLLDETPQLWQQFGDLALQAEGALVKLVGGSNVLLCECLLRKVADLKAELAGPAASALERLLAQRVAMTWVQLAHLDALAAQAAGGSEARVKLIQRQQDAAHRRHLSAVRTLATVRKLLRPAPSLLQIARGLDRSGPAARCDRMAIAGAMPAGN